jgi:AraC-like DNA-binding protein
MKNIFENIKSHPENFRHLSCKALLFTQYDCKQQNIFEQLYSEHNFIVYVLYGKRIFSQPGYSYEMSEGVCVFSKKGGWLSQKEPGECWSAIIFFLPDSYLQQFFKENHSLLPIRNIPFEDRQMVTLQVNQTTKIFFQSILPYFSQSPAPPDTLVELKFRELLFNLALNHENIDFLCRLRSIASFHKQSMFEIMEANYIYNLSLSEFAKLNHLSVSSFKREFKKAFQSSPGKWLIEKRLDHAENEIRTSAKNINDIAFESGFESYTHFSRVFKDRFGTSPLQYRKQLLSGSLSFF